LVYEGTFAAKKFTLYSSVVVGSSEATALAKPDFIKACRVKSG
jgi:hypothetical protein